MLQKANPEQTCRLTHDLNHENAPAKLPNAPEHMIIRCHPGYRCQFLLTPSIAVLAPTLSASTKRNLMIRVALVYASHRTGAAPIQRLFLSHFLVEHRFIDPRTPDAVPHGSQRPVRPVCKSKDRFPSGFSGFW